MNVEPDSPLVCTSVFVSNDKHNLDLRQEHTHFYSKHGDAGHYHYDTTPETVEYLAFTMMTAYIHDMKVILCCVMRYLELQFLLTQKNAPSSSRIKLFIIQAWNSTNTLHNFDPLGRGFCWFIINNLQ